MFLASILGTSLAWPPFHVSPPPCLVCVRHATPGLMSRFAYCRCLARVELLLLSLVCTSLGKRSPGGQHQGLRWSRCRVSSAMNQLTNMVDHPPVCCVTLCWLHQDLTIDCDPPPHLPQTHAGLTNDGGTRRSASTEQGQSPPCVT